MKNQASLQETKQHGALRFPFNIYPCTIPGDFPQVALHWHENMELVFVKRGEGIIQVGTTSFPAQMLSLPVRDALISKPLWEKLLSELQNLRKNTTQELSHLQEVSQKMQLPATKRESMHFSLFYAVSAHLQMLWILLMPVTT